MSDLFDSPKLTPDCHNTSLGMAQETMDYAGPFMDKMFLVIIDSHSKWLEVAPVPTANFVNTIVVLRNVLSVTCIPPPTMVY